MGANSNVKEVKVKERRKMTITKGKRQLFLLVIGIVGLILVGCTSEETPTAGPTAGQTAVGTNDQSESPANQGGTSLFSPGAAEASVIEQEGTQLTSPEADSSDMIGAEGLVLREAAEAPPEGTLDASPPIDGEQLEVLSQSTGEAGQSGIVASGAGRASAAPDLATLRLGVESIANTVSEARTEAAGAMNAVIASVKEQGVAEKDIQTGYFSIQPRYTGREVTRCIEAEASSDTTVEEKDGGQESAVPELGLMEPAGRECFQEYESVITGYEVSNNLTVRVRDLDSVDDVIDGSVEAGGDSIRFNGLAFSLEDTTDLMSEARSEAVENLMGRAAELATLAGVELGDLVYLTEVGSAQPPVVRAEFAMARLASDQAAGISTPISPGEISVQVNVLGQYQIVQPGE